MQIQLETLSYLIMAAPDAAGVVDTDVERDGLGLPYIPGRRLKGLFRESALEVSEMLGLDVRAVDQLFGVRGGRESQIRFGNLRLNGAELFGDLLTWLAEDDASRPLANCLTADKVNRLFVETRYHTAIDPDTGTAQDQSLRVVAAVKPGQTFSGEIWGDVNEPEYALLTLAAGNLRRVGLKRHRGFGRVRVTLSRDDPADTPPSEWLEALRLAKQLAVTAVAVDDGQSPQHFYFGSRTGDGPRDKPIAPRDPPSGDACYQLSICVRLIDPVIVTRQTGDQNLVATERYLPSTAIRGLFASRVIQQLQLGAHAERHPWFQQWFLESNRSGLVWGAAYPAHGEQELFYPPPLFLGAPKYDVEPNTGRKTLTNLFLSTREEAEGLKPIKEWVAFSALGDRLDLLSLDTEVHFHSQRDRQRGHSVRRTPAEGLFYYEALAPGQVFRSELKGSREALRALRDAVGATFYATLGKSRTAQYGAVEVMVKEPERWQPAFEPGNDLVFEWIAPAIFYNRWGFPDPSLDTMLSYLARQLNLGESMLRDRIQVRSQFRRIAPYSAVWQTKQPEAWCWDVGSAVYIPAEVLATCAVERIWEMEQRGLGERLAEGFGQIAVWSAFHDKLEGSGVSPPDDLSQRIRTLLAAPAVRRLVQSALAQNLADDLRRAAQERASWSVGANRAKGWGLTAHGVERLRQLVATARSHQDVLDRLHELMRSSPTGDKPIVKVLKRTGWDKYLANDFFAPVHAMLEKMADCLGYRRALEDVYGSLQNDDTWMWETAQRYGIELFGSVRKMLDS